MTGQLKFMVSSKYHSVRIERFNNVGLVVVTCVTAVIPHVMCADVWQFNGI